MKTQDFSAAILLTFTQFVTATLADLYTHGKNTENTLANWEKKIREVVNNRYDNSISYIVHKGSLFVFTVIKMGVSWELTIWSYDSTFLCRMQYPEEFTCIPKADRADIMKAMDLYLNKQVECANCKTVTSVSNRRIFAGQYCEECWESKFKEIEANMNYD